MNLERENAVIKQWIKRLYIWPPVKEVEGYLDDKYFYWMDGPNNPQQTPKTEAFHSEFLALDSYRADVLKNINHLEHQLTSLRRIKNKLDNKLNNYPTS